MEGAGSRTAVPGLTGDWAAVERAWVCSGSTFTFFAAGVMSSACCLLVLGVAGGPKGPSHSATTSQPAERPARVGCYGQC